MATPVINYDNETGSGGRPPKLVPGLDFMTWKLRFKAFIYYTEVQLWNSIVNGPHVPRVQEAGGNRMIELDETKYTEADHKLIDRDLRALGAVILALPTEVYNNFKDCSSAKELMDAMEFRYEGSLELRESKKDMLKKLYESFEYIRGESLAEQVSRFTLLISDLRSAGVVYKDSDICKKLLGSLPTMWSVQVMIIKRTANLNAMTLVELIGILQSYEVDMKLDDKKQSAGGFGCALLTSKSHSVGQSNSYGGQGQGHSVPFSDNRHNHMSCCSGNQYGRGNDYSGQFGNNQYVSQNMGDQRFGLNAGMSNQNVKDVNGKDILYKAFVAT